MNTLTFASALLFTLDYKVVLIGDRANLLYDLPTSEVTDNETAEQTIIHRVKTEFGVLTPFRPARIYTHYSEQGMRPVTRITFLIAEPIGTKGLNEPEYKFCSMQDITNPKLVQFPTYMTHIASIIAARCSEIHSEMAAAKAPTSMNKPKLTLCHLDW